MGADCVGRLRLRTREELLCYLQFAKDVAECVKYDFVPGFSLQVCYEEALLRLKSCLMAARIYGAG
jgi:hypothetical protein